MKKVYFVTEDYRVDGHTVYQIEISDVFTKVSSAKGYMREEIKKTLNSYEHKDLNYRVLTDCPCRYWIKGNKKNYKGEDIEVSIEWIVCERELITK